MFASLGFWRKGAQLFFLRSAETAMFFPLARWSFSGVGSGFFRNSDQRDHHGHWMFTCAVKLSAPSSSQTKQYAWVSGTEWNCQYFTTQLFHLLIQTPAPGHVIPWEMERCLVSTVPLSQVSQDPEGLSITWAAIACWRGRQKAEGRPGPPRELGLNTHACDCCGLLSVI